MDENKDIFNTASADNTDLGDFDELEAMFGQDSLETQEKEHIVLTQNLDGFASSFPDWDLHPPVD